MIEESEEDLNDDKFEISQINPKIILSCAIFISIGIMIGAISLIGSEIYQAKTSCENNLNGTYDLKFPGEHLCNNRTIYKYPYGWNYDIFDINFTTK